MPGSKRKLRSREPSTAAVLVRMTPEERAQWKAAARARGTSLAKAARAAWAALLDAETPTKSGKNDEHEPAADAAGSPEPA